MSKFRVGDIVMVKELGGAWEFLTGQDRAMNMGNVGEVVIAPERGRISVSIAMHSGGFHVRPDTYIFDDTDLHLLGDVRDEVEQQLK